MNTLEHKQVQVSDVRGVDAVDGIAEAIVSVTNIVDSVNDIIVPGAYKSTLKKRNPKGVWSHDTNIPVAKTLRVEELMPGDPRLPQDLIAKNAGALLVRMQFNLNTSRGRDAFHDVQFFGSEQEWSIGYAVAEGKSETGKDGIRKIKELELYEYSPVIFGAAPHTRTLAVKEDGEALEGKDEDIFVDSAVGTEQDFNQSDENELKAKPGDVKVGDFVSWNSSGGVARGKIEYIMRKGTLGVPDSAFSIDATPEDPAALIRVYKNTPDGWVETEVLVGHKLSTLTKIEDLKDIFTDSPTGNPGSFGTPQRIGVQERHPRSTRRHREDSKAAPSRYSDINFTIPSSVKEEAKRGLEWSKKYNRGGTSVGKNTANYLISNTTADWQKVVHISAYFARHEVDLKTPANSNRSDRGWPGAGLIAWKLWGGDAGRSWSRKLVKQMQARDEDSGVDVVRGPGGRVARVQSKADVPQTDMQDQSEETSTMSEYAHRGLNERQIELADYYMEVVMDFGKFDQTTGADGAHYAEQNPFVSEGLKCGNCVFFEGGGNCHIVEGRIDSEAICKLWVIDETLLTEANQPAQEEEMPKSGVPVDIKASSGGPIPSHTTPVSDKERLNRQAILSVKSPADKSYYRKIFAYHYPGKDGTKKTHYGFIHHHVSPDGTPGAANLSELAAEMAVLNGARGGTTLRGEDRQKVYNHLAHHYRDAGKTPPELKSDVDVDNIMIKDGFLKQPLTPKEQEHE